MSVITAQDEVLGVRPYDRDDDLITLSADDGAPRLRVYAAEGTEVVLGRGSRPELELELEACRGDSVPLTRRRGGGCAVVLDPGNVIVSLVLPAKGLGDNPAHFRRVSDWLIAGLGAVGLPGIEQDGISDLTLGDKKIAGACIYRAPGVLFYSATLLVRPEVALMGRYLRHPPREPDYRAGRAHEQFVGGLAEVAEVADLEAVAVAQTLSRQLTNGLDELARATMARA
jgi:lipoate---protein ligase